MKKAKFIIKRSTLWFTFAPLGHCEER